MYLPQLQHYPTLAATIRQTTKGHLCHSMHSPGHQFYIQGSCPALMDVAHSYARHRVKAHTYKKYTSKDSLQKHHRGCALEASVMFQLQKQSEEQRLCWTCLHPCLQKSHPLQNSTYTVQKRAPLPHKSSYTGKTRASEELLHCTDKRATRSSTTPALSRQEPPAQEQLLHCADKGHSLQKSSNTVQTIATRFRRDPTLC